MKHLSIRYVILFSVLMITAQKSSAVSLNDKCVINILNRTIQVSKDGGWALPNVPSNMGQIRARATCTSEDGRTISGQSDYFNVTRNAVTKVGDIKFETLDPIPTSLRFSSTNNLILSQVDETFQLTVTGFYADNSVLDLTSSISGVNYGTTNPTIAVVDDNGVVTAKANGVALISARKDGVLASRRVQISIGGDIDGDGIPDDVERELGLNPNDPIDALEDQDNDGLSAIEEYQAGTNIFNADTDGDGISDKEELTMGANGIITNPLLADSDGDGIADGLEILGGSNPNDSNSGDLSSYLDFVMVTPARLALTYNAIDGEASGQLSVTGFMLDGSTVDLTKQDSGTRYSSSDLSIASFGLTDGQIFAGRSGETKIVIANGTKSFTVDVGITEFDPVAQAAISIPGYANNVDVQGNLAYVAAGSAGLQILDVSDRSAPEIIGALDTSGTAIDVKIVGNFAYLADGASGLQIIDVSNPTEPSLSATIDTADIAQDIAIQGDFVFVADGKSGIEIINVSNTSKPFSVGYSDQLTNVKGIAVEGSYLVAVGESSLALFDIEDAANPLWLTAVNIGTVKDVAIDNGYVYVAAYSTGYRVYKINESNQLDLKGGDRTFVPRDVAVTSGFTFFAEQLFPNVVAYVNTKQPDNPFFQDTINLSPLGDYAGTGIALDATHAFITEESHVVSSDYKASGNTKLFIAQYRELSDANGIAPTITLTQPAQNGATVEGARLVLAADAKDDIAIAKVEFYVNDLKVGQDSTFPYSIPYSVPQNIENIAIRADAVDLAGTTTKSELVTLNVQNDEDGDGLGDEEEVNVWLTDAFKFDTDDDGLSDGEEVARGTNPNASDSDGDGLSDGIEVENGTDPTNPDVTAPVISSTEPALDETEVPENASIIINFSEVISKKSIKATSISILETGVVPVIGITRLIGGDQQLLFTPSALLKDYTSYTVNVNGVKDLAGNTIAEEFEFTFETGNTVDTVRPTISAINPKNNALDVPVNAALTVVMSERIDPDTFTNDSFYVLDTSTNVRVEGLIDVKDDSQTITFTPNTAFLVGRRHRIYLSSAIKDLFGNTLSARNYYFTTAFDADGVAPLIKAMSVQEGQIDVPLNAKFNILFDEAVNSYTIKNIKLLKNGSEILVNRSVNSDLKKFTLAPKINLEENTSYTLLIDGISDLSGNLLAQTSQTNFTTGSGIDTQTGTLVNYSPHNGALGVALNSMVTADYNERIDPTSVTSQSVYVYNATENRNISGDVTLSADGRRVQFTPEDGLTEGHQYYIRMSYSYFLLDLAGNRVGNYHNFSFTAGALEDNEAPIYSSSNIGAGLTDVPVNAPLNIVFNEALAPHCINSNTVTLSDGVNTISGSVSLNSTHTEITFTPSEALIANTDYSLRIDNGCDVAGNSFSGEILAFTTEATGVADTTTPRIVSISPTSGTVDVSVTSEIVVTFTETLNARNVDNIARIYTSGGDVSGEYTLTENVLRFVPDNPFPGSTVINTQLYHFYDRVGNNGCCWNYSFTTEAEFDTQAPTVAMISPSDSALDVGVNTPVVLTFNESLNASTVNNTNFKLYSNGVIITPSVLRSGDGRTVTLRGAWPAGKTVSVIATKNVKDLSNNALGDYVSTFSTAVINNDITRPSVKRLYPPNGASNVPSVNSIVMYTSEAMNESTLTDAFHVAENGVLVDGTLSVSASGQAIEFTPDEAFSEAALVHVYLDSTAQDSQGNAMTHYQGSFRMSNSVSTVGTRPSITAYIPANGVNNVVLNPKLQVVYNQDMDETTITDSLIVLRKDGGEILSTIVSLEADKRTVTIAPSTLLLADTYYYVSLSGNIKDIDGDRQYWSRSLSFTTSSDAVEDLQQPTVVAMSPGTGMVNVPLNPRYHVKFDEPINPVSFAKTQDMSITFSSDNQEVLYSRYSPLVANSEYTETLIDVKDVAGNAMVTHSEQFMTGNSPDIIVPNYQSYIPYANSVVAVNSGVTWQMNEVMDPISVNNSTVYVQDLDNSSTRVAGHVALANDGKTIHWVSSDNLLAGRRYRAYVTGVTDISGNVNSSDAIYFTTNLEEDLAAPEINQTSITEGLTEVPTNARIRIQFNEAVNSLSFSDINVTVQGEIQAISYSLDATRTLLTLTPLTLLPANAPVTLSIDKVRDLAGNELLTIHEVNFTTGSGVDTQTGTLVNYSPHNGAIDVALNGIVTADYNERIDPTSVTSQSVYVYNATENRNISGDVTLSADGRRVQFTPEDGLTEGHQYYIRMSYSYFLLDLAGNRVGNYHNFSFTAGALEDNEAPIYSSSNIGAGLTDVPVNAPLNIVFNEALAPHCINSNTVTLSDGVNTISGSVSLNSTHTEITFTPSEALIANTDYSLRIDNGCDVAGNSFSGEILAFTTEATGVADTTTPRIVSISPTSGTVDVSVTSEIVVTFTETLNARNVDNIARIYTSGGDVSGEYTLTENVLRFVPDNPFPGSTVINTQLYHFYDRVGNRGCCWNYSFTTENLPIQD
jgi:hypothetical protein